MIDWGRWCLRFLLAACAVWVVALTSMFLIYAVVGTPIPEASRFVSAVAGRLSMGFFGLALISGAVWFLLLFWDVVYGEGSDE